jgi:hypothetical protein
LEIRGRKTNGFAFIFVVVFYFETLHQSVGRDGVVVVVGGVESFPRQF